MRGKIYRLQYLEIIMKFGVQREYTFCFWGFLDTTFLLPRLVMLQTVSISFKGLHISGNWYSSGTQRCQGTICTSSCDNTDMRRLHLQENTSQYIYYQPNIFNFADLLKSRKQIYSGSSPFRDCGASEKSNLLIR